MQCNRVRLKSLFFLTGCMLFIFQVEGWPDGAPCIHAVLESMNPLEAVEHQGGLQLTIPPFHIEVEQKCYWANQPIAFTLQGNSTKEKYKGFAIQPIVYKGSKQGRRIGQFLRLDDNGSWQLQCFRQRNSVTHSHDEPKKRMQLWWKNDEDDTQTVQFVATVVVSLRKFWVKTVFSDPIPPCNQRQEIGAWQREAVTPPPAVSAFKMDTFRMFNREQANFIENSISSIPLERERPKPIMRPRTEAPSFAPIQTTVPPPLPTTTQDTVPRRRLNHVIPIPDMEVNRRPRPTTQSPFAVRFAPQLTTTMRPVIVSQNRNNFGFRRGFNPRTQNTFTQNTFSSPVCRDFDTPQQCFSWIPFCSSSAYMRSFCPRTCRFC
ncbi:reeler domain-containing protein [Ditylenchus destructor]|uniref:Reeler domain-containing protein n=1 Tax=Ditylenchus destructor TaxID=166010 RepID=A0AAD4R3Y3_9BILA|nr:reeler domain-containing protein [Ditylenchus destructor]